MDIQQIQWTEACGWKSQLGDAILSEAQLILLFGARSVLTNGQLLDELKSRYPNACLCGCSTSGEIHGKRVFDHSLSATAVQFNHTKVREYSVSINGPEESFNKGLELAGKLAQEGLVHVFVLCDGLKANGTDLVEGLVSGLPGGVTITGGLAGDGDRFEQTYVFAGNATQINMITAIGFYGNRLKVGYGSFGGWDAFGPERMVTRSKGNVLYELDGKSALELYKTYLGEHASGLPATGLLFPLSLRGNDTDNPVVRTILSIDEKDKSITFAGTIPEGTYARFMKANFDRLIEGAQEAAIRVKQSESMEHQRLAVLISCVGRKLILKQRVEEEVECVAETLGNQSTLCGFYSYGEISPFVKGMKCELHNQTMTITTFSEE